MEKSLNIYPLQLTGMATVMIHAEEIGPMVVEQNAADSIFMMMADGSVWRVNTDGTYMKVRNGL